jgi:CHAT domain-containing protein
VIIPDGPLSLVPWAALPIGERGAPLGALLAIRTVPSLAILDDLERAQRGRPRPTRRTLGAHALIVGDPAMPHGVPSLPGAREEAHAIADTILAGSGAVLLTDSAATVEAVMSQLRGATLLHFATHAAAFPELDRVRGSFLQLSAADATGRSVLTVGDILNAAETWQVRLSARLVVLSACETGAGATSLSEGVLGFQRAFLALGAESLLVSLWRVDDAATRALMAAFYRHWFDDADAPSVPEALRRAQSDLREGRVPHWRSEWAKPSAWAAFQVVGAG